MKGFEHWSETGSYKTLPHWKTKVG